MYGIAEAGRHVTACSLNIRDKSRELHAMLALLLGECQQLVLLPKPKTLILLYIV
jgi:hypothetical protein